MSRMKESLHPKILQILILAGVGWGGSMGNGILGGSGRFWRPDFF